MPKKTEAVAYDDVWWNVSLMSGSAHFVSHEATPTPPTLLVPDGHGGYKEHALVQKPRGKMGF